MDCFGRSVELEEFWEQVARRSLLLLAPRRIGKTVLLNELHRTAPEHGFVATLIDVEGLVHEREFLRALCNALQTELSVGTRVMSAFNARLNKVFRGDDGTAKDWQQWLIDIDWSEFADQLLAHLNDHKAPRRLVLVDELPVFVQGLIRTSGPDRARSFLYTLRGMRQRYPNLRWLFTGSVGLDSIARRYNIEGALNDLDPVTLDAFPERVARDFVEGIAERRGHIMAEDAKARIISRLGWLSPYYLERVTEDACARAVSYEVSRADADEAMDQMLAVGKRLYWAAWREHLERNFEDPERAALFRILAYVARHRQGISFATLQAALFREQGNQEASTTRGHVDTLVADGFLCEQPAIAFRMGLLREWWLRFVAPSGA